MLMIACAKLAVKKSFAILEYTLFEQNQFFTALNHILRVFKTCENIN